MVDFSQIPVVILAGGKGTRLSELTRTVPKPMVLIKKKPIISHIISHYFNYGFKKFIVATGYKSEILEKYFITNFHLKKKVEVECIFTGSNSMTGGRIKKIENYVKKSDLFMFTYGDGVSNVNLLDLYKSHIRSKKIITLTAVRPPARFGFIKFNKNEVKKFNEKKQNDVGWINGGFFIANKKIFKFLKNSKTVLESDTLEKLASLKKLNAYKHSGFWQCVDTLRDKEFLDNLSSKIYKFNE